MMLSRLPIGFVGLGVMGRHMAAHLSNAAGQVLGYDVDPSVWEKTDSSIQRAEHMQALGEQCPIIFLSLPGPAQVIAAIDTLGSCVRAGSIIADTSTIDPDTANHVFEQLLTRDIAYVQSPVIGGQKGASEGSLTIIAGGQPATVEVVRPYLTALGKEIHVVDTPSEAAVLKLLNNYMSLGNTVILAEALALGGKAGVSPETIYRVLRTGSGFSAAFERRWHANIKSGNYAPGFAIDLAVKDLTLIIEYGAALGLPLFAGSLTTQVFRNLQLLGWGNKDVAAIAAWWEEAAHISLKETSS
ncbi:MAG TPA: NAD(P)-dependent oxidoreductase [Ktedonobacteraceae bacterium]|nr:NAD(P)-dependent oxidoreductase [Ktedonobacteraceae bacterium]